MIGAERSGVRPFMERSTAAMEKKDGGFTLIELLIALAVLSIMAGVLLQSFVVSRRMNTKARKDELLLDAAKRTMEELKGYPFEELEKFLAEGEGTAGGRIMIGNTMYRIERLEEEGAGREAGGGEGGGQDGDSETGQRQGYRLTAEYGHNPSGDGRASYIISAEADFGKYSREDDEMNRSYSINRYEMPNIADVSSFQNAVIDPQTLMKEDELLTSQLLMKVNEEEETGEGLEASDGVTGDGAGESSGGDSYSESEVERYLRVHILETVGGHEGEADDSGVLTVQAEAVYTVEADNEGHPDPDVSIVASLASVKRNIVREDNGRPSNRIYLFLPDKDIKYIRTEVRENGSGEKSIAPEAAGEESGFPGFDRIFISYDLEDPIEFFLVAGSPGSYEQAGDEKVKIESSENSGMLIYTNIGEENEPISYHEPENRLYHLTVTVYEADYSGTEGTGAEPGRGREILKLDSTKSE